MAFTEDHTLLPGMSPLRPQDSKLRLPTSDSGPPSTFNSQEKESQGDRPELYSQLQDTGYRTSGGMRNQWGEYLRVILAQPSGWNPLTPVLWLKPCTTLLRFFFFGHAAQLVGF